MKGCEKGQTICEDTCEAPGFKCTELPNIVDKTAPVKASSEQDGHPARHGADIKSSTYWATATEGKYFGRDSLFLPPPFPYLFPVFSANINNKKPSFLPLLRIFAYFFHPGRGGAIGQNIYP